MTSRAADDVTGPTNPRTKLIIAGTVGGACAVLTACFVLCILVCRRWIRDKRAARRRLLKRRQRSTSTNSSTVRSNTTPTPSSGHSARNTLPSLPGEREDVVIPFPPEVAVTQLWNRPNRQMVLDWSTDAHRAESRAVDRSSPFMVVDVPSSIRRSSTSSITAMTLNSTSQDVEDSHQWQAVRSPLDNGDAATIDSNFNLSQYIIQRNEDPYQHHYRGNNTNNNKRGGWHSSSSADSSAMARNRHRADLADNTRERNTWELTHRSPIFPTRLIAEHDGEPAAGIPADEDVWIRRMPEHISRPRAKGKTRSGHEPNRTVCADFCRTRTTPTGRLWSTRS